MLRIISVILCGLACSTAFAAPVPKEYLDDMKLVPAGWLCEQDSDSVVKVTAAKSLPGKALEIGYDMKTGKWLGVRKKISGDLSTYKGIRFAIRGEGSTNSVEVKFEYRDYTNFGISLPVRSSLDTWTTVDVPFADLNYLWGADQTLDVKKFLWMHIAVSIKNGDDAGGAGKILIGPIELY